MGGRQRYGATWPDRGLKRWLDPQPRQAVFALLADATSWRDWAGPLVRESGWERPGDVEPEGVGAIRHLGTRRIFGREKIVEYEPPRYLAYVILSGQPVREYRAEVVLTEEADGTSITWRASFVPRLPGTGHLMRWYLGAIVRALARRLAAYAERESARPT